jgi:hypothetical protein
MPQREGKTCLCKESYSLACHIGSHLIALALQWLTGDRLLAGCKTVIGGRQQFNPAKTVFRCMQYYFEEGSSTNEPA